jgi:hypothetical protein
MSVDMEYFNNMVDAQIHRTRKNVFCCLLKLSYIIKDRVLDLKKLWVYVTLDQTISLHKNFPNQKRKE